MKEFNACFADLEDPREDNAHHDLLEVLMIALCTMVCGGEDCANMALFGRAKEPFLRQFLRLRQGIPSHDTFGRLFAWSTRGRFTGVSWVLCGASPRQPRGCGDRRQDAAPFLRPRRRHLDVAPDQRLGGRTAAVLGQLAVDGKSNEITAVPKLLEMLSLKGTIVTG